MAAETGYNPDHRGYTDLESLFRGNFDEGALKLELGKDSLPPKPKVIWDVQTGHRRLCPAPEAKAVPEDSPSTASTAASESSEISEAVGPPGYRLSVARGPLRHTAPGEFFAQFRFPPDSAVEGRGERSEVLAAVNSLANEQQAIIDNILEQCDKVSRMILLSTANALRESNANAQKPMPWMTARAHIKSELGRLAGLDEVHRLLDIHQLDHPENEDTLLYCSPEDRNVKLQMESFLLQSVKKFAKNERICEFDLERVQKRLHLHSKDAEGVLNYAGHEDSGKAAQRWLKQTEALAVAALKDHEMGQHKIFQNFAQTLSDTTGRMMRDSMGTTGFSMSETNTSFPDNLNQQSPVFLQAEEKDMLQGLEMQKKKKEKHVWELKRQLDELIAKRKKMDEESVPQKSVSEGPKANEQLLQKAKSVRELDQALESLEEERQQAKRMMDDANPQMARMAEFMTTGQRNLRALLEDLKRAEAKQEMVQEKLEEAVWPESKNLVHDMVRNKEIAVDLLDASILPVAPPVPSESTRSVKLEGENVSEMISDAKAVSNQQLVAAARRRQQLRQDKEAKEAEIEELRRLANEAKAAATGRSGNDAVQLDDAEASLGLDTGLLKDVKTMCLQGNMLLSDLRNEQKDNHVEELPHAVAHVMEAMKEAIAKTSKVIAGKVEMDAVPVVTGEFEDVEIAVMALRMAGPSRGNDRRGALKALKRSTQHVADVEEDAVTPTPSMQQQRPASSEKLQQLRDEVQTNRAALAQLERRVQRMRVAVRQAGAGRAGSQDESASSMASLNATQTSWPSPQISASSAVDTEDHLDHLSVGSEFDSDAEDLAPASTLQLPRKSTIHREPLELVAPTRSSGAAVEQVATGQAGGASSSEAKRSDGFGAERGTGAAAVSPTSQAETLEKKKQLRALKQAKLVYEGLQEDIAALRLELNELRAAKGLRALGSKEPPPAPATVQASQETKPDAASGTSDVEEIKRTASGRLAQLVRSHSGKILEGLQKSGPMGFAMIGNAKALDKQKRELASQVKSLKQEVQKKKKLLMAMVPKDNLQDLINAGVFPGDQKSSGQQEENSVDKQVTSLKNKLETLKKSVGFWQTRLETHVQRFNAMIEGPPAPKQGVAGVEGSHTSPESSMAQSQEDFQQGTPTSPLSSGSRWKTLAKMKSSSTLGDLSEANAMPGIVMSHRKTEPATSGPGAGGLPSLQASGIQVSSIRSEPTAPPKASDLLNKLKRAGGLAVAMQRGGVLHHTVSAVAHQRDALRLSVRRNSRDSTGTGSVGTVGAEGLSDLVPEGHRVVPAANVAELAQNAVLNALEEQDAPQSPKKEVTRAKAFTALKRQVGLLQFAAHARVQSKGNHRDRGDSSDTLDENPSEHRHSRLEDHRPHELDDMEEDSGSEIDIDDASTDQGGEDVTPRTKLSNAMMKVKMTNYLRKAAQEVRAEAQRITEAAKLQRQSTAPVPLPPRLSVTESANNLMKAAGLPLDDAERLESMMQLLSDEFLPFVYNQLHAILQMPLLEQKMALKMLSLGHVEAGSPMRSKGDGAKSLGIASLLATQLLAMKQALGLWDEATIRANALLKTLELDQEADAVGELQIAEEPEDDEDGRRLLAYYKRQRAPGSMRGGKKRFVDAFNKPFMGRSTVRRPKNTMQTQLELEGEHVDVVSRPALPTGPAGHVLGSHFDPHGIDLESGLDPEELSLLRRAQSWNTRLRKREELDDAGSEGMRGYRRRASRDLEIYDSEYWDEMRQQVRSEKVELYEELEEKHRQERRALGLEGEETPRASASKSKATYGGFQFGGARFKEPPFRKSKTLPSEGPQISTRLAGQMRDPLRGFWQPKMKLAPLQPDFPSLEADTPGGRQRMPFSARTPRSLHSHSPSSDRSSPSKGKAALRLEAEGRAQAQTLRNPPRMRLSLDGHAQHGNVPFYWHPTAKRKMAPLLPQFSRLRRLASNGSLGGRRLARGSRSRSPQVRRPKARGSLRPGGKSKAVSSSGSLHQGSASRRGNAQRSSDAATTSPPRLPLDALAGATEPPTRASSERPGHAATLSPHPSASWRQQGLSPRKHLAPLVSQSQGPSNDVSGMQTRILVQEASRRTEVRTHREQKMQHQVALQEVGAQRRGREASKRPLPEEKSEKSREEWKKLAIEEILEKRRDSWRKLGTEELQEKRQKQWREWKKLNAEEDQKILALRSKSKASKAKVKQETETEPSSLDVTGIQQKGWNKVEVSQPAPPPDPRPAFWQPKMKEEPLRPQFSSLRGGFAPKDMGGRSWPKNARRKSSESRTDKEANEVSEKAKEILSFLQSFHKKPLQRLLSSRDGRDVPRSVPKTEPRRPSGEAKGDVQEATDATLPPIKEKEGAAQGWRAVSSQAAAWAKFLEERLGRHLRTISKSTPPPNDVKIRDIRSLLLD